MAKINRGRYTAKMEQGYAVLIIGMRVNKLWAIPSWLPVFTAMGRMIRELYTNKEWGFLSAEFMFTARGVTVIQYWRSFGDMERYAKEGGIHLKAWREFNQLSRKTDAVGIYHESYLIEPGQYENVYVNMPPFGLGKVGNLIPADPHQAARDRLRHNDKQEE